MLSGKELKDYRQLRNLSLRDTEPYCDVTIQLIQQVETGVKPVTEHNHQEIVNGINRAYFAKCNGTFERPPIVKNKPVVEPEVKPTKPVNETKKKSFIKK